MSSNRGRQTLCRPCVHCGLWTGCQCDHSHGFALMSNERWTDEETMMHSVDFTSVEDVVAAQTIACLIIPKWPVVRCVSKRVAKILQFVWSFVRSQPKTIYLRNTRCTFCGWFTNNCFPEPAKSEAYLCVECHNISVCSACTYFDMNGWVYCGECEAQPGIPKAVLCIQRFVDYYDLYTKLEIIQNSRFRILSRVWKAWSIMYHLQRIERCTELVV